MENFLELVGQAWKRKYPGVYDDIEDVELALLANSDDEIFDHNVEEPLFSFDDAAVSKRFELALTKAATLNRVKVLQIATLMGMSETTFAQAWSAAIQTRAAIALNDNLTDNRIREAKNATDQAIRLKVADDESNKRLRMHEMELRSILVQARVQAGNVILKGLISLQQTTIESLIQMDKEIAQAKDEISRTRFIQHRDTLELEYVARKKLITENIGQPKEV